MKNKNPTTTVSVEMTDRDAINAMAEDLNLSQREMISRMVESYKRTTTDGTLPGDVPPKDQLGTVKEALEKVIKRDDRIVAFIREQEKLFHSPILKTVQTIDANLQQLIKILSNLD